MKKIAMLFPYAPSYREPIYKLMDNSFDVDWYFCGDAKRPMKLMDYRLLKRFDLTMSERTVLGPIHFYKGLKELPLDKYDTIIVPTVIRCLSMWWLVRKFGNKASGPKVYLWAHGWYGKETGLKRRIKRFFYKNVDGFLLYNKRAKELMIQQGFDASKLYVIFNSLNYEEQLTIRNSLSLSSIYEDHFHNKNKNIIFIGRLTSVKRFDLLIDAAYILKQRGENINITFIGDGVERDRIENLVRENGLESQVWFYGSCFDEKTNAELIYNADLCISPGNIGLTAMHVMMFGCPAITNDDFNHQMPEFESIKEGLTGGFFKHNDSLSLADSISNWFKNHGEDRVLIRKNCYAEIDTHWNPNYQVSVLRQIIDI